MVLSWASYVPMRAASFPSIPARCQHFYTCPQVTGMNGDIPPVRESISGLTPETWLNGAPKGCKVVIIRTLEVREARLCV